MSILLFQLSWVNKFIILSPTPTKIAEYKKGEPFITKFHCRNKIQNKSVHDKLAMRTIIETPHVLNVEVVFFFKFHNNNYSKTSGRISQVCINVNQWHLYQIQNNNSKTYKWNMLCTNPYSAHKENKFLTPLFGLAVLNRRPSLYYWMNDHLGYPLHYNCYYRHYVQTRSVSRYHYKYTSNLKPNIVNS